MISDRSDGVRKMYAHLVSKDKTKDFVASPEHQKPTIDARQEMMANKVPHKPSFFNSNYADEIPPEWISTSKSGFAEKHIDGAAKALYDQIAVERKVSHLAIGSGTAKGHYISSHKRDFVGFDVRTIPAHDYKKQLDTYRKYPSVFCDENNLTVAQRVQVDAAPKSRYRFVIPVNVKEHVKTENKRVGDLSDISLGTSDSEWTSASKSALLAHPTITRLSGIKHENLEKRSTNVTDWPDMVPCPWESIYQSVYARQSSTEELGSSSDNLSFIDDLKATHFTLGTSDFGDNRSSYKDAFQQKPTESKRIDNRAKGANSLCVVVEDFEDRRLLTNTCNRQDYKPHDLSQCKSTDFQQLKRMNVKSSLSLGQDPISLEHRRVSVSKQSYRLPKDLDEKAAELVYMQGGKAAPVDKKSYVTMGFSDEPNRFTSVQSGDYQVPMVSTKDLSVRCLPIRNNPINFCEFEEQCSIRDRKSGLSHGHYTSHILVDSELRQKLNVRSDGFEVTVLNTVGRDPDVRNEYLSSMKSSFTDKSINFKRQLPVPRPVTKGF